MKGFRQHDIEDFGESRMGVLSRACHELSWLLDRGYPKDTATSFVADRYQLTKRQRLLLSRVVSGDLSARRREDKRVSRVPAAGSQVSVDGFNAIVTLEVALTGGPVVSCQDRTVRDLAGMRGTYHPCEETGKAIGLLLGYLKDRGASSVEVLIDAPVSNSGRLRAMVLEGASSHPNLDVTCELERDVDAALVARGGPVVTSDSVVIDGAASWLNAVAEILEPLDGIWMIRPMVEMAAPDAGER